MVKFSTFNVRGLCDSNKFSSLTNILFKHNSDITFLQETHFVSAKDNWEKKWKGVSLWGGQSSRSAGVAIVFHHHLDISIEKTMIAKEGRYIGRLSAINKMCGPIEVHLSRSVASEKHWKSYGIPSLPRQSKCDMHAICYEPNIDSNKQLKCGWRYLHGSSTKPLLFPFIMTTSAPGTTKEMDENPQDMYTYIIIY